MIDKILGIPTKFSHKTEDGLWEFELLVRPKQKNERARVMALTMGNSPVESFLAEDYNRMYAITTLQLALISGPRIFVEKYDTRFENIPDDDIIMELYQVYITKEVEFNEAKKKYRPAK